ncbi:MAG: hypothetical protein ACT4ON_00755 [Bacteroidota bacterium]
MKTLLKYFSCIVSLSFIMAGCVNYRKLVTDEIVFIDGSSQTGTIIKCDSMNLRVKKADESISILPWSIVDTVQGKKYKTLWLGANFGYYNIPYFSVFRNEAITGKQAGMQGKIGLAFRGNKLYYFNLTYSPAKPYKISKFGFGYQRYLGRGYLTKHSPFWGTEFNLMNVEFNNGPQLTLEPFTGFDKKLNEYLRIHFKFGLQFNLANKNNQTGFNTTIGIQFMKRNFKKHYAILNKEHRISRY